MAIDNLNFLFLMYNHFVFYMTAIYFEVQRKYVGVLEILNNVNPKIIAF